MYVIYCHTYYIHGKITLTEYNLTYVLGLDSIKKTETLFDATKKVGLEVNAEETKYMLLSRHQNADVGQLKCLKR
jgi:hypothetical protein